MDGHEAPEGRRSCHHGRLSFFPPLEPPSREKRPLVRSSRRASPPPLLPLARLLVSCPFGRLAHPPPPPPRAAIFRRGVPRPRRGVGERRRRRRGREVLTPVIILSPSPFRWHPVVSWRSDRRARPPPGTNGRHEASDLLPLTPPPPHTHTHARHCPAAPPPRPGRHPTTACISSPPPPPHRSDTAIPSISGVRPSSSDARPTIAAVTAPPHHYFIFHVK